MTLSHLTRLSVAYSGHSTELSDLMENTRAFPKTLKAKSYIRFCKFVQARAAYLGFLSPTRRLHRVIIALLLTNLAATEFSCGVLSISSPRLTIGIPGFCATSGLWLLLLDESSITMDAITNVTCQSDGDIRRSVPAAFLGLTRGRLGRATHP